MCFKNNKVTILLAWLLGLMTLGCSIENNKELGIQKVIEFRYRVKRGNYAQVYEQASLRFKQSVDKNKFIEALQLVSPEIGEPENFVLESFKTNNDLLFGTSLTLVYRPKRQGKVVLEEYVFIKENGDLYLFNYRFDNNQ